MKLAWPLALWLCGCSTLADQAAQRECAGDDDCEPGFLCDASSNQCRRGTELPPVRYLGFDVTEVGAEGLDLRVEIEGCDVETEVDSTGIREIEIDKFVLTQTLTLTVFGEDPEDAENPTRDELIEGALEISQPSRFARDPTPFRRPVDYPTEEGEAQTIQPTVIRWARYQPDNFVPERLPPEAYGERGFLLWTSEPDDGGPLLQMVVPPRTTDMPCLVDAECCEAAPCDPPKGTCVTTTGFCRPPANPNYSYRIRYDRACNRTLVGRVALVDDTTLSELPPVGNAEVRITYAADLGAPRLGLPAVDPAPLSERPFQCETDAECIEDQQFCDIESNQCFLNLTGRPTGPLVTAEPDGPEARFSTQVYTYCEDDDVDQPLDRVFDVTVTPPSETAHPALNYRARVRFGGGTGGAFADGSLPKPLCVPDLGAGLIANLALGGMPQTEEDGVELVRGYVCCDVGCLPATAMDVGDAPPDPETGCTGRLSTGAPPVVRLESPWTLTDEQRELWLDPGSPCEAPVGEDGVFGVLRRAANCTDSTQVCTVEGLAGTATGPGREYAVRVETPPGSVLGSTIESIAVSASQITDEHRVVLPRRALVQGRITLPPDLCDPASAPGGDCGSEGAVVLAERLAFGDETTDATPGPYFHQIPSFYDPVTGQNGAYVLPLDRGGVYVVTALPAVGSEGGPASFALVDLRLESSVELDFVLELGTLVTLDVATFDRSAQVVPLDIGSWEQQPNPGTDLLGLLDPNGELVDLDAPGTCLALSTEAGGDPAGCRIRRLIPGSNLALTQVGQVRFSARDVGGAARVCN